MSKLSAEWVGTFESIRDYKNIPAQTLMNLIDYVVEGRKGGDFLNAVLTNNLLGAYQLGDVSNLVGLWAIVTWMTNRAPRECWGHEGPVQIWPGYRRLLKGVVVPEEHVQPMIDEWVKSAIKGTVFENMQTHYRLGQPK